MFLPESNNQNNQSPSFSSQIQSWWASIPFMTKLIFTICTLAFVIDLFTSRFLFSYFYDNYILTIRSFQIWRVLTPWMVHLDVLQLIFSLLSVYQRFLQLEKGVGSTVFFLDFLLKNAEIQVLFLILSFLFNVLFQSIFFRGQTSSGLWTIVMLYISINGFTNPDQETPLLCFPVNIKAKFLPFILLLFFSFTNEFVSMLSALIIGYTETRFFDGMLLRISQHKTIWIEEKFLKTFIYRGDFISVQNINSPYFATSQIRTNNSSNTLNNIHNLSSNTTNNTSNNMTASTSTVTSNLNNSGSFGAFQGKGVVIGSNDRKNEKADERKDRYVELNVEEEKKNNENNNTNLI